MLPRVTICLILAFCSHYVLGNTWEEAQSTKKAHLEILWTTSKPFIYTDPNTGELTGIEYEIGELLKEFVKKRFNVSLTIDWVKRDSFVGILDHVKTEKRPNVYAVSAFSITEERERYSKFSKPYLPDITVLISSEGTPIVHTFDEIHQLMANMQAVTIEGTTYEALLLDLKEQLNIDFDITYIGSEQNIFDFIQAHPNYFGFVDLPVYLMHIKGGSELVRQNFFTVRGTGYGFLMPKESDWNVPMDIMLFDRNFRQRVEGIISKYISTELFQFIDEIYNNDHLSTSILTKEKELQLALIQNANLRLQEEQESKRILVFAIIGTSVFLMAIGFLYYKNRQYTRLLLAQKEKIEAHEKDISQINKQLLNRNKQLIAINDKKNNLVRILAHDLRSPLSQIISPAELLSSHSESLDEEDKALLFQIGEGARRINQMITKILDVDTLDKQQNLVLKEPVDVTGILMDLEKNYRPIAKRKDISLTFKNCNERNSINSDRMLLYLIIENLISNAIKFSPKKSNILVDVKCQDAHTTFGVHDEGPGFSEEDKKLLFQSFQKLSAQPTGGEESTGLGLSIVNKYVSELGGKVWLESNNGQGSSFFVRLPV